MRRKQFRILDIRQGHASVSLPTNKQVCGHLCTSCTSGFLRACPLCLPLLLLGNSVALNQRFFPFCSFVRGLWQAGVIPSGHTRVLHTVAGLFDTRKAELRDAHDADNSTYLTGIKLFTLAHPCADVLFRAVQWYILFSAVCINPSGQSEGRAAGDSLERPPRSWHVKLESCLGAASLKPNRVQSCTLMVHALISGSEAPRSLMRDRGCSFD